MSAGVRLEWWSTESRRSGERRWGRVRCEVCTYARGPYRIERARAYAEAHAATHPGALEVLEVHR